MDLIYYRGLNCHTACVINVASCLGINYTEAFATLWSETDFLYEPEYRLYSSKRLLPNIKILGVDMQLLNCEREVKSAEGFSIIQQGDMFIIGMDTFYIPWNQVYQAFHEAHFFFAIKENADSVLCFDPTYNKSNMVLTFDYVMHHAFELCLMRKREVIAPQSDICSEAHMILQNHPKIQQELSAEIYKCKDRNIHTISELVRKITAMINNRYLFQRFLQQNPLIADFAQRFFNDDFFLKWEAVKNGVNKCYVIENNESLIVDVNDLFLSMIRIEIDVAEEIVVRFSSAAQRK